MKVLIVLLIIAFTSCGKLKVFVLEETDRSKFYIHDSVNIAFNDGLLGNKPIIAIDGIVFNYQQVQDTILLPLKRKEISSVLILNKASSSAIYGEKADDGAVVITSTSIP